MTYRVVSAPECLACDTSAGVTSAQARALAATTWKGERVRGLAQYVPIDAKRPGPGDITAGRLQGILAAGLGLWLVQHVKFPTWIASAQLGADMGGAAAQYAKSVGYLPGCNLGVDQEGCRSVGRPVADFLEAWAKEVAAEGFTYPATVYEGFAAGLTAEQLYEWLPDVHSYWSDYGPGRAVAVRGFEVVQHAQQMLPGLPFYVDLDTIKADLLGGRLQWMIDDATYPLPLAGIDPREAVTQPEIPLPFDPATVPPPPPDDETR